MCDRMANRFLQKLNKRWEKIVIYNVWVNEENEPLAVPVWWVWETGWVICWWRRLARCPIGGAHSHWAITADWHPDFNPHSSQLRRDRPPLLCQRGLRAPLCDAGSFQPRDPWGRKKRPKRVSGLTLALCTQRKIFNLHCTIIEGLLISSR